MGLTINQLLCTSIISYYSLLFRLIQLRQDYASGFI